MNSQVVNSGEHNTLSKVVVTGDDAIRLVSPATVYNDMLTGASSARVGVISPTFEAGFRGDANSLMVSFVNNQADELQFDIQFSHAWAEGTKFFPHVHFSPEAAGGANNAAQFILGYRFANVNDVFPANESTYTMTKTWAGDKSWYHYIADNAAGITVATGTVSCIMKCRVYRDNTVTNNLAGKLAVLYFDWHIELDGLGSREEYVK